MQLRSFRLFDQERRPIKDEDKTKSKQGTGKKEEVISQCGFRHKGVVEGDEPEHAEAQRTDGRDGELVSQDGDMRIFLTKLQGSFVETQKQKGRPGKCPKDTCHAEQIKPGFVEQPGNVERTRRNDARNEGGDIRRSICFGAFSLPPLPWRHGRLF